MIFIILLYTNIAIDTKLLAAYINPLGNLTIL